MNFDRSSPFLMGILNVTPDSFYDGGEHHHAADAVRRAREMIDSGADIIDVGGESTRPGAKPVSVQDELDRVVPVVEVLLQETSVPVSIDTTKPEVAERTLSMGARMLNVVTGLENPDLVKIAADHGVYVVIMHMQGNPRTMQEEPEYDNVVAEVKNYLDRRARSLRSHGISSDRIILDPGIGFGKTLEHNRRLMANVGSLKELGYPVMVGHSRKSFLNDLLGLEAEDRLSGTLAVSSELIRRKVDCLRVHDLAEHEQLRRIHHWLNK